MKSIVELVKQIDRLSQVLDLAQSDRPEESELGAAINDLAIMMLIGVRTATPIKSPTCLSTNGE